MSALCQQTAFAVEGLHAFNHGNTELMVNAAHNFVQYLENIFRQSNCQTSLLESHFLCLQLFWQFSVLLLRQQQPSWLKASCSSENSASCWSRKAKRPPHTPYCPNNTGHYCYLLSYGRKKRWPYCCKHCMLWAQDLEKNIQICHRKPFTENAFQSFRRSHVNSQLSCLDMCLSQDFYCCEKTL